MIAMAQRFPVATYVILAFGITWGGILAGIGLPAVTGATEVPEARLPLVYVAALLGPSTAGLVATGLVSGRAGLRELWARMRIPRPRASALAFVLLLAPLAMTGSLLALSFWDDAMRPAFLQEGFEPSMLALALLMGLVVGACEEVGWTGFVLPRIRARWGTLASGIGLGLVWGLWHLPMFSGGVVATADPPPVLALAVMLFAFLVPYRLLMAWMYERTRSLGLAILMHAPLAAGQLAVVPADLTGWQVVVFDLTLAGVLWVLVVLLFGVWGSPQRLDSAASIR